MKTFFNLVQEVQKPGLCHRCGGCVAFCTAVNYGALELDDDGKPRYKDMDKCIECGLCYLICPEIDELDGETKKRISWSEPIGRIMETSVARAVDPDIRKMATDGGVVTGLLLHLFDSGHIDGAIVTRQIGRFQREPILATTREEIIESAGFFTDTSHGISEFGDEYMAHRAIEQFSPLMRKGLRRVALVGTPCQIHTFRRMETIGVMPSDSITITLGLFCSGNFIFGEEQRKKLADIGNFNWDDVSRINIKEQFMVYLKNGEVKGIDMENLDFMKRYACRFCDDYSSQYADISFGGIGAPDGWTTVIARSPKGRAVFADARSTTLQEFSHKDDPEYASNALIRVMQASAAKRRAARANRRELNPSVIVKD